MQRLTNPQWRFLALTILLSCTFFYALVHAIHHQLWLRVLFLALGYGTAMFFNGLFFGRQEAASESRTDLGFRYHLLTYAAVNAVYLLSLFLPGFWPHMPLYAVFGQLLAWGLGLLIHYLYSRNSIKGYDPEEIF
jgi:hypothetical protein